MLGDKLRKKSKENNKLYRECIEKIELQLKEVANKGKLECEIKFEDLSYEYEDLDTIIRYFEKNLIDAYEVNSYFGTSLIFRW
jgi:hypothetical protein